MTAKDVLAAALALDPEDRAEIAAALEASLPEASLPEAEPPIDPELLAVVRRRLEAYRAGGPSLDGDEVLRELAAKYPA